MCERFDLTPGHGCQNIRDLFPDLESNSIEEKEMLDNHLNACPACSAEAQENAHLTSFLGNFLAVRSESLVFETLRANVMETVLNNDVNSEGETKAVPAKAPAVASWTLWRLAAAASVIFMISLAFVGRAWYNQPSVSSDSGAVSEFDAQEPAREFGVLMELPETLGSLNETNSLDAIKAPEPLKQLASFAVSEPEAPFVEKDFPVVLPVRVVFTDEGDVFLRWDDGDPEALYRIFKSTSPDFDHAALVVWREVRGSSWQDRDTRPGPAFYRVERLNG